MRKILPKAKIDFKKILRACIVIAIVGIALLGAQKRLSPEVPATPEVKVVERVVVVEVLATEHPPTATTTPTATTAPTDIPIPTATSVPTATPPRPTDLANQVFDFFVEPYSKKYIRAGGDTYPGQLEYEESGWFRCNGAVEVNRTWFCEVQVNTGHRDHWGGCWLIVKPENIRWPLDLSEVHEIFFTSGLKDLYNDDRLSSRAYSAGTNSGGEWSGPCRAVTLRVCCDIKYGGRKYCSHYTRHR